MYYCSVFVFISQFELASDLQFSETKNFQKRKIA